MAVAEDIEAGVRIHTDGACLDASLAGLMSDRRRIEALLLAELNMQREATPQVGAGDATSSADG